MAKSLPNLLSVARIIVALCLPFAHHPAVFLCCYLACGISDVLDGYIARKYHLQTALGAKLDSLGDFVFWLVVLILLFVRTDILPLPVIAATGIIAVWRLVNLIITRKKFHQWGMLHSLGNKLAGLLLYIACLLAVLLGALPWYAWAGLFLVALISSAEETVILLRSKSYDANAKGLMT